jgi:hypothetical protein
MTKIVVRAPDNNLACKSEKGGLNWAKVFFFFFFLFLAVRCSPDKSAFACPGATTPIRRQGFFFLPCRFYIFFSSSSFFVELKNVKV